MLPILTAALCLSAPPADPRPATVKIVVARPSDAPNGRTEVLAGTGSGTVVHSAGGRALVLTNKHVVPDGGHAAWVAPAAGGPALPARFVAADGRADLALLAVACDLPAAALAPEHPALGSRLRFWGCPGGGPAVPREGAAVGYAKGDYQPDGAQNYLFRVRPEVGDSGGGLFDAGGRLVAVNHGRREPGGVGVATGLDDVGRFLHAAAPDVFGEDVTAPKGVAPAPKAEASPERMTFWVRSVALINGGGDIGAGPLAFRLDTLEVVTTNPTVPAVRFKVPPTAALTLDGKPTTAGRVFAWFSETPSDPFAVKVEVTAVRREPEWVVAAADFRRGWEADPKADPAPAAVAPARAVVTLYTAPHRCRPCREFAPVFDSWAARFPGVEFKTVPVPDDFPSAIPLVTVAVGGSVKGSFTGSGTTEAQVRAALAAP